MLVVTRRINDQLRIGRHYVRVLEARGAKALLLLDGVPNWVGREWVELSAGCRVKIGQKLCRSRFAVKIAIDAPGLRVERLDRQRGE